MKLGRLCVAFLLALALSPSLSAAPERSVTIVVESAGAPVAGALVRIAADEMDAVGTTDAQGRVIVKTTSVRISVVAEKDGAQGAANGTANVLTVALQGGNQ